MDNKHAIAAMEIVSLASAKSRRREADLSGSQPATPVPQIRPCYSVSAVAIGTPAIPSF